MKNQLSGIKNGEFWCGSSVNRARTAVFISGSGSTLQSLLEIKHQINLTLVVTNRKNALGILRSKRFGVPVLYFDKKMSFAELSNQLKSFSIQKIFLAGFMKIIPPEFIQAWQGQILNIHPSLLPAYKVLDAAQRSS